MYDYPSFRSGAKIDLLIMIAVGFGLSEALTISGGAKMVAGVRIFNLCIQVFISD
jgi:hypothetical protein